MLIALFIYGPSNAHVINVNGSFPISDISD